MRLHVFTTCWNERLVLPYFLRHYEQFAERIVVYDNGSDDGSQDLVRTHPLCELREFSSGGEFDEFTLVRVREQAWRDARLSADWVIVCDTDEFVVHPGLLRYLANLKDRGVTICRPYGFQMLSDRFPTTDGQIYDEVRRGTLDYMYSKPVLFDPSAIREMNFAPGSHFARPAGRVVYDPSPDPVLLHFKYLGLDYVRDRYRAFVARRSASMRQHHFGHQYEWNLKKLTDEFNALRAKCRPLEEFEQWRDEVAIRERASRAAASAASSQHFTTNSQIRRVEGTGSRVQTPEAALSSTSTESSEASDADRFRYIHSTNLPDLLESLNASLVVSTYQAGKLIVFTARAGRISMLLRSFDKVMGVAVDPDRMAVATNWQVWTLYNSAGIAARLKPPDTHDACFLPRTSHVTGSVDMHEIAWAGDELWLVNTSFSCLCTLESPYSFVPRWQPPFIRQLARQDFCHLNGLAVADGRPRYVTAFGETDTREGWRPNKVQGGCLIDVDSGETVARGLSMPHSPRVYDGRLWVLNSGHGRLAVVDRQTGTLEAVADLPGYTRGLAFLGRYAFVGLSKIRETSVFGGVPIAEKREERKCGVQVVDTLSGQVVAFLEFQGDVAEVFDVQLLPGLRNPTVVGFRQNTIQRATMIGPMRSIPERSPRAEGQP